MKRKENEKRSGDERVRDEKKNWKPAKGQGALIDEERSLDIGESERFAPGGHFNRQGVNEPRRTNMDDDILPPARGSRMDRE
ncbi:MAG: hypothetical protein ACRD6N_01365 [Pyrinomonadaceae bacterium]